QDNCIHGANGNYGTADGGTAIQQPEDGFTASNNLNVAPGYANPAAGDYSLPDGSPCQQVVDGGDVTGGTDNQVPPSGGSGSAPSTPSPTTSSPDASTTQPASRKCRPAKKCRRLRRARPA